MHIPRPRDDVIASKQLGIIAAHVGVVRCVVQVRFHERRIDHDGAVDARQFKVGCSDGDLRVTAHGDAHHRLGKHAAGIGKQRSRCVDDHIFHIRQIEEGMAAEVDREGTVRIPSQYLLKADLIDDAGIIKATLPIGEGDCSAATQPRGDLRYRGWILYEAGCAENLIVIHVAALQRRQASGATGDVGECRSLGGDGYGRLLGHVNAVGGAARAVPLEPV